jgi:hypothetical protein
MNSKIFKSISDAKDFESLNYRNREIIVILFATIINRNKDIAWKSLKDENDEYWFEANGDWFIVGLDTPDGPFATFFKSEYWDAFDCKEVDTVLFNEDMINEPTRLFSLDRR